MIYQNLRNAARSALLSYLVLLMEVQAAALLTPYIH